MSISDQRIRGVKSYPLNLLQRAIFVQGRTMNNDVNLHTTDCPTGMLVDLSEPVEIEKDGATLEPKQVATVSNFSSPIFTNTQKVEISDQNNSNLASTPFDKHYLSDESDCDFLDNEMLDDLTRSLSHSSSGDELFTLGCESTVLKTTKTPLKKQDNLSVKELVEVFKEATSVAVHIENLTREPPSTPKIFRVTPLLERTSDNLPSFHPKQNLKSKFDLDKDVEEEVIRKQRCNIENTPPAIPQLNVKPEARVPPMLKLQISTNECSASTISKTLRVNKNRMTNAAISATRPVGPLKATKQSPSKTPLVLSRTYNDCKSSLTNTNSCIKSKANSPYVISSNVARFSPQKTKATISHSASFGAHSMPQRRRSALPSTSFSYGTPTNNGKILDEQQHQTTVLKISTKPNARKSFGSACATPITPFSARNSVSFAEPSPKQRSIATLRLTPNKSAIPKASSLVKRSNSDCGQNKRRSLLATAKFSSLSTAHK